MNTQSIHQLASQRVNEVRHEATSHRISAADREPRDSIKERAGWILIHVGLRLTGPPVQGRHARPYPAGL